MPKRKVSKNVTPTESLSRLPLVSRIVRSAEANRAKQLEQFANGAILKGFEQLLSHTTALRDEYRKEDSTRKLTFLLERAIFDFEIALDAALVGAVHVGFDRMRDAMEIHFLLRDFLFHSGHLEEWLAGD